MGVNKKNLLKLAEEASRSAGDALRGNEVNIIKSWGKDIKIDSDKIAHKVIFEVLSRSKIPIFSEEDETHDFNSDLKWVVDPLDGSMNLSRGIPDCAVSIGLWEKSNPILGVVYNFNRGEMFTGIVGIGAWLNGESIGVSDTNSKEKAIIMTGFPSYTDYSVRALNEYVTLVQSFKKVRLIGSAALSLAYVASARADVYYEKDIKIWDVAAGLALVRAAGGEYRGLDIKRDGECTVFASNKNLFTNE